MAIKEESDFLSAKAALEKRNQETKILNLNYEIDPNGKPDREKSKRRFQRTVDKLLNAFLDAWPVLRLRYIASYEDYQYLESMPEELKRLEFYIFIQSETSGMMIADFFRECYTDEWELKPDCKYIEVIKKARKEARKRYFAPLQLFAEDEQGEQETTTTIVNSLSRFLYINSKPYNELSKSGIIEDATKAIGQPINLQKQKKTKNGKEIKANVDIDTLFTFTPNKKINDYEIKPYDHLTGYQKSVAKGVINLFLEAVKEDERPYFSINQLYKKAMPGGGEKIPLKQRREITAVLITLSDLYCKINLSEQLELLGIKENDVLSLLIDKGYIPKTPQKEFAEKFFNLRLWWNNKGEIEKFEVLTIPVMLYQAVLSNHYFNLPAYLSVIYRIGTDGKLKHDTENMTPERQAIVDYLLQQIYIIKQDAKQAAEKKQRADKTATADYVKKDVAAYYEISHTILFDTVFDYANIGTQNAAQLKRHRDFCFTCLENFKQKDFIKDYKKTKKGRTIAGVKIEF